MRNLVTLSKSTRNSGPIFFSISYFGVPLLLLLLIYLLDRTHLFYDEARVSGRTAILHATATRRQQCRHHPHQRWDDTRSAALSRLKIVAEFSGAIALYRNLYECERERNMKIQDHADPLFFSLAL